MLTTAERADLRKRLRFVADLLIDIRATIPPDELVAEALAIRGIQNDVVTLAASIDPDPR